MSSPEAPRDEASADETELPTETGPEADTEFSPFAELSEEFKPSPAIRSLDGEGLPVTMDQTTESDIPRLSPTTLVCMEDRSAFVVRNGWGEELLRFPAGAATRTPIGTWRIPWDDAVTMSGDAIERYRAKYVGRLGNDADAKVFATLVSVEAHGMGRSGDWLVVEPVRPACQHYVRQRVAFELNAQHSEQKRLCAARRTTEGTFMSVRDAGIWACDMREPQDFVSVQALDDFDALKVEQGKNRTHLPMFGSAGGIFESKGPA